MDSKLVVEQMSGRWKIKHPDMKPLALQAQRLAAGLSARSATPGSRGSATSTPTGSPTRPWTPPPKAGTWAPSTAAATPRAGPAHRHRRPRAGRPTAEPTTTLLLRHGETALSGERRFAGRGDIPLTDTGLRPGPRRRRRPRRRGASTLIVTSPLQAGPADRRRRSPQRHRRPGRGPRTACARPTSATGRATPSPRSGERWPAELDAWLADPSAAPPGGESFDATSNRVRTARDKLLVRHREQTVAGRVARDTDQDARPAGP